ncbi:MAG TPA: pitrilysin family protein [Pyrinomonadaceae bacterium]|nr:pitrilysin family protein [Pyrinomonadaceae bacterium]
MKKPQNRFRRQRLGRQFLSLLACLLLSGVAVSAQNAHEPQREQLLNGLKLLFVNRPGDPEVILKLRVHSGAAFDLAGKEGTMALLGDALFDAETRQYVAEEMGGRLDVSTGFDAINITLAGRAADFERMVELLRTALLNTQLAPDVVERLRAARVKTVREISISPETIADRAIAARLFGAYPYGRLAGGSPETLARVERSDLLLARERFLNSNNATLVVIGGVDARRAQRVLRQSLGPWRKSERIVPASFRQPEAPDARTLIVDFPGTPNAEVRLAVRGFARSDRDSAAASALALIARDRWVKALPGLKDRAVFVRHDAHAGGGIFRMGASVRSGAEAAQALESARKILNTLAATPPTVDELENAKRVSIATVSGEVTKSISSLADTWLDEHTYGTSMSAGPEFAKIVGSLTPADAQRVAARLFLHTPFAAVAVGEAAQLKIELARAGGVEVFGAAATPNPPPSSQATPPQQQPSLQLKRP